MAAALLTLVLASSTVGTGLAASPWPKFHGGAANARLGVRRGAVGKARWSFRTGARVYSSPAIEADGTVVVDSNDGKVYALDPNTGKRCWTLATGGPISSSPAIGADGTIYFGSQDKKVYAPR